MEPSTVELYLSRAEAIEQAGDAGLAFAVLDTAFVVAMQSDDDIGLAKVFRQKGIVNQVQGDYHAALQFQLSALEVCERLDVPMLYSDVLNNIGSIHHYQDNYDQALIYYERCLAIRKETGNPYELALSYNNFGALYEDLGKPEKALANLNKSLEYWTELGNKSWMATTYANIGVSFQSMGMLDSALTLYQRSLDYFESIPGSNQLGHLYMNIGQVQLLKGRPALSLESCRKAQIIAEQRQAIPLNKDVCYCLYQAHDELGQKQKALEMYRAYITHRDSLSGQDLTRQLTTMELDYEYRKQILADSIANVEAKMKAQFDFDSQLSEEREQRNLFIFIGLGILFLSLGLWNRLKIVNRAKRKIQEERDRSDELLLNILPAAVASELKEKGRAEAKNYDNASVLFTDFVGFTSLAESMTAHQLVEELNVCFKKFDQIIMAHGLEKIKTIGDAYMAVCGVPQPQEQSADISLNVALDMIAFMKEYQAIREGEGLPAFRLRVGIHTGPVVAGIVGDMKFQYDIWGDTVNTASRLESLCEPGLVNISEKTFAQLSKTDHLIVRHRKNVAVKGKGKMDMVLVSRG